MKALIDAMAGLPKLVKLILCIPALDIIWTIYRLCRSIEKKNIVGIVLAVVLLIVGIPFVWLIDLICVILKGEVWWID
ncbi:MAG: hypothetical protein J6K63_07270 [Clostridia bacterium]|nr:hypothetical protein [Clostridia bacterium]